MPTRRIVPPLGGAANASAYAQSPARFAPASTLRNCRAYDVGQDRPRMGSGPGISRLSNTVIGGGRPIQALATVTRPAGVAGYTTGATTPITAGLSVTAPAAAGQVFSYAHGPYPVLSWDFTVDVSGEGGPGSIAVHACERHKETDLLVVVTEPYDDGSGDDAVRVVAFNELGQQVWSTKLQTSGVDRTVRTLSVGRLYSYVCVNELVVALRNDTGAVTASTGMNGWSGEAIETRVVNNDGTTEYLFVAFNGAQSAATLPNAPHYSVTAGAVYAASLRAGVMKYRIPTDDYATGPVFTQIQWGRQLAADSAFFESAHGYFRVSENSRFAPRGAIINGLAVDSDGSVYVVRCNAGAGPNATWKPDLTVVDPITVMKIGADGRLLWEADTDSIIESGVAGVLNDIPTGATDNPSVQCVGVNGSTHEIYVGGRANEAGVSLFKMKGSDGTIIWSANYTTPADDSVSLRAIRVDTDGAPVLVGDRNSDWDGASAANAEAWKVTPAAGVALWAVDLGVDANGLTIFPDGRVILATDEV